MSVSKAVNPGAIGAPITVALSFITAEGNQAEETNVKMESLMRLELCRPLEAKVHDSSWAKIVTPLRLTEWERALALHPDEEFKHFVCSGLRDGFRIGFDYRSARCKRGPGNMKSVQEHEEVVEQYIRSECEAGRLLGPLERSSYPQVHVSPFGVIPKSEPGKWRLILDLSSPCGSSVNDGINKEWCSLSYVSVDDIAARVVTHGKGALMAKFDLKSAYRQVPIHPDDRFLLGMAWKDQLYVDTALPFGLRSAPAIFNAVAEALAFIIKQRGVSDLDHYLDDFSIVGSPRSPECGQNLEVALAACAELGFPVATEKTEGPVTTITLLGIELDSEQLQLRLPQEKLRKLRELVEKWRRRKTCSKRELQSLAGHLNHACKVIRPGRRFLRGVFGLLSQFHRRDHWIRLNAAFRADMEWWHVFAQSWNGVSLMRDRDRSAPVTEVWSDASGGWGCGAWWGPEWFQVAWSEWPVFAGNSIAAKELLPIIVAVAIWGPRWVGSSVLCHCDNENVVAVIRGGYCKDPSLAHMLRCLFFLEAKFDVVLTAVHVPGVQNGAADSISRNNLQTFFNLHPQAHQQPCLVPRELVQHLVTDTPWTSNVWSSWLKTLSMIR